MMIYSEDYDFEEYEGELKKVICVFFIPRSGGNFLAEAMQKTNRLGFPLEYFSPDNIKKLGSRFDTIVSKRTSPNGVFGFKWNSEFQKKLPFEPDYIIFLDRKDQAEQACSYAIAQKTGDWLQVKNTSYKPTQAEIAAAFQKIKEIRENTLKMLPKEPDKIIYYEDLMSNYEEIINEILFDIEPEKVEVEEVKKKRVKKGKKK